MHVTPTESKAFSFGLPILMACCLAVAAGCTTTRDKLTQSVVTDRDRTAEMVDPDAREQLRQVAASSESANSESAAASAAEESAESADSSSDLSFEFQRTADRTAGDWAAKSGLSQHVTSADWSHDDHSSLTKRQWNIGDFEQLALRNNPAILQAAAAASRLDGALVQSGLRPNPGIGYFGQEIGNEGNAGQHGAFVSQTFVTGNKLEWNRQIVRQDVRARRREVEVQRRRVLTDVRIHFLQALAAQRLLELTWEFRNAAAAAVRLAQMGVDSELRPKADVLQSEMQLAEAEIAIQQVEQENLATWRKLVAVAGVPDLLPEELTGTLEVEPIDLSADELAGEIMAHSPLLEATQFRARRAQCNLRRQQLQNTPNVTAQLGAGHDDSTGDGFANVQLSVPLPVRNDNRGNIHAAWAEYCEATQRIQRIRMQIRHDLADVLRDFRSAQAAAERYESDILPKARETLELMQEAEVVGQREYDFLRVFTARRAFFDANMRYVAALADMATANAKIDGLLLTGGLSEMSAESNDGGLRGQSLSQQ